MSIAYNEAAIPGRHTIHYRVRDYDKGFPAREVEVLATPDEIQSFAKDGYLVREQLLPMSEVERLRDAFDAIIPMDQRPEKGARNFGGIFIRHMMDRHPAFLEFLKFPPTLSIARAVFGSYVNLRGFTGRVCFPDDPGQDTEWHFHQRVIPDPLPPFFMRPQTMDVLLYLDDIAEANGPLRVVPGSHLWIETDLQKSDYKEKPGQVTFTLPAGSAVLTHGSLWHRSLPTQPGCTMRRLLLFGYGPGWMKHSIYGEKPQDGLTLKLLEDPNLDEESKELLGVAGYM